MPKSLGTDAEVVAYVSKTKAPWVVSGGASTEALRHCKSSRDGLRILRA